MLTLCAVYPLAFTQNGIKWKHTQREYYEELRVFFLFCFIDFVCIGQMSVALYGISSSVRVKMFKLRQYKNRIRNLEHLPSLYCRCVFNLTLEAHCCNCNYWYFARNDFFYTNSLTSHISNSLMNRVEFDSKNNDKACMQLTNRQHSWWEKREINANGSENEKTKYAE